MDKFIRLTATACPLDVANLNTDQLLPARFLKVPRSAGLATALLRDLRFDADGRERPDFPLNRPAWRDAKIVVGGRNFGCGSSREAAVYALCDYGIHRAILRPHVCRQCGAERTVDRERLGRCGGRAHGPARRDAGPAPDRRSRTADDPVRR